MTSARLVVARKEVADHLRDTRSLISASAYALMGPAVVMLVSLSPRGRSESMPLVMVGMLSVFALVAAFAGSMNVAADMMAGERERRSLLPLLLTPIGRRDVIIGKWMAASVFGIAALALNVAGFVAVLAARAPGMLISHASTLLAWTLLGLVPLAVFGAALQLRVAGASRSMKEATTSLTFVTFLPMIVGLVLVFFPVTAEWWTVVPIAGQHIVIDSAVRRGVPVSVLQVLALALVTTVSAAAPLASAGRVLGRDDITA
jgi:sodium transport system permease protein